METGENTKCGGVNSAYASHMHLSYVLN